MRSISESTAISLSTSPRGWPPKIPFLFLQWRGVGLTRAILALALRARYARPKSLPAIFVEPSGFVHTPCSLKTKGSEWGLLFLIGGEGGIRTHVPELPDHPISSRRRYDHFGTSPLTYGSIALT
jgi:hypothetical protein